MTAATTSTPSETALGVLRDGFVVSHPADGGRRVIELDPQGAERRVIPLPR
jgi:hypothetical protein